MNNDITPTPQQPPLIFRVLARPAADHVEISIGRGQMAMLFTCTTAQAHELADAIDAATLKNTNEGGPR